MLRKRRPHCASYKVCLICIETRGTLTGQCYVDEGLHVHVMPIYQNVWNNFLFKQDNVSIPAMWQVTVWKLAMSYSLTSLPDPTPSLIDHPWDNLDWWVHDRIPSQPPHFPDWNTSLLNNKQYIPQGVGWVHPRASFEHAPKAFRMHS